MFMYMIYVYVQASLCYTMTLSYLSQNFYINSQWSRHHVSMKFESGYTTLMNMDYKVGPVPNPYRLVLKRTTMVEYYEHKIYRLVPSLVMLLIVARSKALNIINTGMNDGVNT